MASRICGGNLAASEAKRVNAGRVLEKFVAEETALLRAERDAALDELKQARATLRQIAGLAAGGKPAPLMAVAPAGITAAPDPEGELAAPDSPLDEDDTLGPGRFV